MILSASGNGRADKIRLISFQNRYLRGNDAVRSLEARTPGWRPVIPVPGKLPEPFELDRFNVAVRREVNYLVPFPTS